MKPLVVITVRGGLVESVASTAPVTVLVEDWDCPPDKPLVLDFESDPLESEREYRARQRLGEFTTTEKE